MKIRDGFMLHEVAGQWVIVPLGERVVEFNGIMMLTESGALLWKVLEKDVSEEELVQAVLMEYFVDAETAKRDVREFIEDIRGKGLLE
ncbi:hypothetical protein Desor_5099 [Desulfosporosinus orientis DSM 765]|uniref:Coenzyme PQQ synthesis protein D (PqqD) n=1 Tax=Desulfosporosinus orientis (strain ATCC 19365 / DSM 765 / NCIMB 8382 / VKM B-1628 / Singapore I) TaxID=768706 RepID=G7WJQ3_DESOD|nr:PqqD family protein [Desulfosporosinus orientis]AET70490.1 hypothetical protein Desor_5099 [Desulfosporosinus orientis DSM 765]